MMDTQGVRMWWWLLGDSWSQVCGGIIVGLIIGGVVVIGLEWLIYGGDECGF